MTYRITIGRNADNNVVVYNPYVSGYHAELIADDSLGITQYTLVDHSSNGTYVNGQFLHNSSCFVAYGDMIMLAGKELFDWSVATDQIVPPPPATWHMPPDTYHTGTDNQIGFVEAFRMYFRRYVDFKGRSTRREYWFVALWFAIISTAFSMIAFAAGIQVFDITDIMGSFESAIWFFVIWELFCLATFLPSLALLVRRIHDTGKDGLWILMSLVPLANIVFLFIWTLSPSDPRPNKWG